MCFCPLDLLLPIDLLLAHEFTPASGIIPAPFLWVKGGQQLERPANLLQCNVFLPLSSRKARGEFLTGFILSDLNAKSGWLTRLCEAGENQRCYRPGAKSSRCCNVPGFVPVPWIYYCPWILSCPLVQLFVQLLG